MILYPDPRGLGIVREQHRQSALAEAQRAFSGAPFATFTQPALMQNAETGKLQAGTIRRVLTYQGDAVQEAFEPYFTGQPRNAEGEFITAEEAAQATFVDLEGSTK